MTIVKHFERFQHFNFETDFLEVPFFSWKHQGWKRIISTLTLKQIFWKYRFLVESTKVENALFPYKTAISKANIKANRMVSTKWTYHKERSFASNYFIFLKILFQFKNLF